MPSAPLRKSTGFVATMTRTAPVGPITSRPSTHPAPRHSWPAKPRSRSPTSHRRRRSRSPPRADGVDCAAFAARSCRRLRGENRFGRMTAATKAGIASAALRLPASGEQLLRRQAMPACNLGDNRSRNQRLFKKLRPVIGTPPPSAYRPGDHLEAAHLALRLKSMVKPRHKTIPPNQDRQTGPSTRCEEGEVGTAVTVDIAKRYFQVHGITAAGETVLRRKLTRDLFLNLFSRSPSFLSTSRLARKRITGRASWRSSA